jgi:hypothetical protein
MLKDLIYCCEAAKLTLNQNQKEILFGLCLGDISIAKGLNVRLSFKQT